MLLIGPFFFQYCQKQLGLPRQLKTNIAFSMFPILDTNLCKQGICPRLQNEYTKRRNGKLQIVLIAKKLSDVRGIAKSTLKLFMKSQRYSNVISVPENLDLNGLYCLINKLFIQKWIVMFADKKFTIHSSLKDIKLQRMESSPWVHFIVKIALCSSEVRKICNIILQTNINRYFIYNGYFYSFIYSINSVRDIYIPFYLIYIVHEEELFFPEKTFFDNVEEPFLWLR